MTEYNSLEKIRLQKLEELRAEGVEAYPTRAHRTHLSVDAIVEFEAKEKDGIEVKATLAGRIRASRAMGKVSFAHIEDGAGKIQLFLRANELGKERVDFFNKMLDLGDFVQAEGVMFRTKSGEVTLHVHDYSLLAKSVSPLPAAKDETLEDGTVVRHAALDNPELRARQRYADLAVNPDVRETFRKRAGIIKALRDAGFNVLMFDYRGYGRSEGSPTEDGVYRDGRAAFDYLSQRTDVDSSSIILFGTSLGGAVAVDVATHRPAAGLILEATFSNAKDVARIAYPFLPAQFILRSEFNSEEKIRSIRIPTLIIHGGEDNIIPVALGRKLYDAANEPKSFYLIPGADHNDTFWVGSEEYLQTIRSFARSLKR